MLVKGFFLINNRLFFFLLLGVLIGMTACEQKKQIDHFNSARWQQDQKGCSGQRLKMKPDLDSVRQKLKGLSQVEVIDVLGKPDYQLLYKRHQKFYVYFMEEGTQCQGDDEASKAAAVSIRFNALDFVTEVVYTQGKPI
jgi:hypothetical protein